MSAPPDANVIEVRDLRSQFGAQVVHDHLDLDVRRGEILGVVGGSGSGKSVLLRSIIGLNRPAAGSIRLLDVEMTQATVDPILSLAILVPLAIILPLAFLPSIKGAVVGLQWANRMHGFDPRGRDPALPEEDPALVLARKG